MKLERALRILGFFLSMNTLSFSQAALGGGDIAKGEPCSSKIVSDLREAQIEIFDPASFSISAVNVKVELIEGKGSCYRKGKYIGVSFSRPQAKKGVSDFGHVFSVSWLESNEIENKVGWDTLVGEGSSSHQIAIFPDGLSENDPCPCFNIHSDVLYRSLLEGEKLNLTITHPIFNQKWSGSNAAKSFKI